METPITSDPAVCGGQAIFRGTRIPVHVVLEYLSAGNTIDEVLQEYPELTRDAIHAGLAYAASLARDEVLPV